MYRTIHCHAVGCVPVRRAGPRRRRTGRTGGRRGRRRSRRCSSWCRWPGRARWRRGCPAARSWRRIAPVRSNRACPGRLGASSPRPAAAEGGRHLGHLGRADLVARGADRRADPDEQVAGGRAERRRHRLDRLGHHAAQRSGPAAVRDARRPVHRVEEHDGGAVRHQDRERGAGHRGDHGVGRRERGGRVRDAVMPPAGQRGRDDRNAVGMPLVGDGQPVHAERRRQAAPVLRHRLRVVPYVPAEVKAAVDALAHPAVPRRDDRGHLFGVEGKCAQRKG